jgi:putative Holliday junction resolvase
VSKEGSVVLAFDFGLRRIGIASGNLLTRTASPVATLNRHDDVPWPALDRLIAEWQPAQFIVGMPEDGGDSALKRGIELFTAALRRRYDVPVATVDESLTSRAAHSAARDGRRSGYLRRRVDKGRIDKLAACLIAEQWMTEIPDER